MRKAEVLKYFGKVMHNLAAPYFFAEIGKSINHIGVRNDMFV